MQNAFNVVWLSILFIAKIAKKAYLWVLPTILTYNKEEDHGLARKI